MQTTLGSRRVAVLDSAKVRVFGSIGIGLTAIGVWELAAAMEAIDTFTTSRPSAIFAFLASVLPTPEWWFNTWVTLSETLIGLSIGVIAGGLSGALLGMAPRLSGMLDPYITLLNSLPRVALAPLLVLWFGIDMESKIALVVSIVYFIMLVGTRAGMQTIDPDVRMMAVTLGLNRWHLLYQVNLPSAIPSMLAAFKLSSTYALLGAVTGELISAKAGLGQQLSHYAATFRVDGVMGTLLFLALFATVLNALANRFEAWLLRWQVDGTS